MRDGEGDDVFGAGFFEGATEFFDRRTRGEDVIDNDNVPTFYFFWYRHVKAIV